MRESAGNFKVLMIAFGHPDNVLSLCKALSDVMEINLIFVVSGNHFRQGIFDIDLSSMPYGLNDEEISNKFLKNNIKEFIDNKFSLRFLRTPTRKILKDIKLLNFKIIKNACKVINGEKYQVVHYNGISGFMLYFKMFLKVKKNIWTLHDYLPHTGEENPKGMIFQKLLMKFDFEYIQHYSWLRNKFIEYYKCSHDKVHHVYSGSFEVFRSFQPKFILEEKNYILFFGRISPYKGLDFLLNSFMLLLDKNPNRVYKLVIAGNGFYKNNLIKILKNNIIFLNRYIGNEELVGLIKNCAFVVVPYSDSTHSAVVMTAYAFNKPVVATDVGGLSEVIVHNETGYLVRYGDEKQFAFYMEYLLVNDNIRNKMSENIENLCTKGYLNWRAIAEKMLSVYKV